MQIVRLSGTRIPSKLKRKQIYLDKDSEGGAFNMKEIAALEEKCGEAATKRRPGSRSQSPAPPFR